MAAAGKRRRNAAPAPGARPAGEDGRAETGRVAEIGWLLVVVVTPLLINPWGASVFDLPKIVFLRTIVAVLAAFLLWSRLPAWRGPWRGRVGNAIGWRDPLFWAGLLATTLVVATIFAPDRNLALWGSSSRHEGLYTALSYLLLFALVATELRRPAQVERLAFAIALGSLPIVAYGLPQSLGLDPIPWQTTDKSRVFATIGRSNFLGSYLVLAAPFSAAAIVIFKGPLVRIVLSLGLGGTLAVLALTEARSAWIGLVVALLVVLAVLAARRWGRRAVLSAGALAIASLAVFALAYLGTLALSGHSLRGLALFPEPAGSIAARLTIWRAALGLIAERPLLGFGPDGFGLAFHHVFPPQLVYQQGRGFVTDRAHDILIQQAVTAGIPGLLAYAALLAALIAGLLRALTTATVRRGILVVASLVAVIGHLVDLLFSFDVASTAAVFWVIAGAAVALSHTSQRPRMPSVAGPPRAARAPRRQPALAALFLLSLSVLLAVNVAPLIADTYAGLGLRPDVPLDTRLADAGRAVAVWPYEPAHWSELGALQRAAAARSADARPMLAIAERSIQKAVDIRPLDPVQWTALAELHGYRALSLRDEAAYAAAEAAYERAIALAPDVATLHAARGGLALSTGRVDLAVARLERAISLDVTDGQVWRFIAEGYRIQGRAAESAAALAHALRSEAVARGEGN